MTRLLHKSRAFHHTSLEVRSEYMRLPIHVLSLPRATGRRQAVVERLSRLGLGAEIHDAPDADTIGLEELEHAFGARAGQGLSPATPGDMACTLGHLAIWARIADGMADAAVVLEDDAVFGPALLPWVADDVLSIMSRHDTRLLRLETRSGERLAGRPLGPGLWRLTSAAFGSAGYVLTREGAQTLLARRARPGRPVDHLLWGPLSPLRRSLGPVVIRPAVLRQDTETFPSLIATARDRLDTRRPTLRDRAGRALTRIALATGRAQAIDADLRHVVPDLRNEPGTSL